MTNKRYAYVVTAVGGDLSVLPTNLKVGTILLEKRGRGRVTAWDWMNFETGATATAAGRKIGVGHVVAGKLEWVGGTPPEAQPRDPDCGHACCDERNDPHHDHFLTPSDCPGCGEEIPDGT